MTAVTRLTRDGRKLTPVRKATNVTLPETLVKDARELGINVSQACEKGLAAAVSEARGAAWLRENKAALEAWNAYVEEHGIPLEEYRQF